MGKLRRMLSYLWPIHKYGHTSMANYPIKFKEISLQYINVLFMLMLYVHALFQNSEF